jgi:isopentenyl-diphosphate delta-isomerase
VNSQKCPSAVTVVNVLLNLAISLYHLFFQLRENVPNPLDQVTLVDLDDQVIGVMDKVAAHRGAGVLHRAVSIFLFNDQHQLLLQQRSAQKIVGAMEWANTCCGNVRPGESYEECAYRRLKEELGIVAVKLHPLEKFIYQVECNSEFSEYEMDQVFAGFYAGAVKANPKEVKGSKWVKWSEVKTAQFNNKKIAPWFALMLARKSLINKLERYAK